jgi:L-aminopeptidase/D-esterase-like protein
VRDKAPQPWHLPVAAETYNGWLSDNASFPVTVDLALAALDDTKGGPVAEGNVVGGTGMVRHEFKGGTAPPRGSSGWMRPTIRSAGWRRPTTAPASC